MVIANKLTFFSLCFFSLLHICVRSQSLDAYYDKVKQSEERGDNVAIAESLNSLGHALWNGGKLEKAVEVFNRSVAANLTLGNTNAIMVSYSNIGMIYTDMGQYESSLLYFRKSLGIRREFKDKSLVASCLINISTVLQNLERYDESVENALEALESSKEVNEVKMIMRCYGLLAENYEKLGNQQKSMEYFTLYSSLQGYIHKKEISEEKKKSQEQVKEAKVELEKIEKEKTSKEYALRYATQSLSETRKLTMKQKKALNVKELMLREQEKTLRQRNMTIVVSFVAIVLIGLITIMVFFGYRMKKKSSEVLSAQNKEITLQQEIIKKKNLDIMKSINYAQRIQQSMLPNADELRELMPESFIYFRPRDVVSGDFYWFTLSNNKEFIFKETKPVPVGDDSFLVAAVDCTGHGVPGAFMSMIGYNLLDEIVSVGIVEPNEVLDALHLGIKNLLNQEHTDNKDGMDIALCKVYRKEKKITYSGAKNPLVYIKNGELFEIRGDKFPIGGHSIKVRQPFVLNELSYADSPVMCYIFTDGYQDQFGGVDGGKFMSKNFKELLLRIHKMPVEEQERMLEKTRAEWMGEEHKPIDDTLVIGFRLC